MAAIRRIAAIVTADISQLQSQMLAAQNSVRKAAAGMISAGTKLSMGVTLPILAVGKSALTMAMDAVESENLFTVSMGKMEGAARQWSESLRQQLGLNAYDVRKNVAVFNVMFRSMDIGTEAAFGMSKGLTQLAYDMASFYNLSTEEAFEKLKSGIMGESKPLKELGIIVNETTTKSFALKNGIIKQGQAMSENQKIAARYGLIMKSTALSQNDLARTITSPINKLRIFKESVTQLAIDVGMKLMPTFSKVIGWLQNSVTWFSSLSPAIQKTILVVGGLAAAIGPLLIVAGTLISSIGAIAGVLAAVNPVVLAVAADVVVLGGVFVWLYKTQEKVRDFISKAWEYIYKTIVQVVTSIANGTAKFIAFVKPLLTVFTKSFEIAFSHLDEVWKNLESTFDVIKSNLADLYEANKPALQAFGALAIVSGVQLVAGLNAGIRGLGGLANAAIASARSVQHLVSGMLKLSQGDLLGSFRAFESFEKDTFDVGKYLADGLVDGMSAYKDTIEAAKKGISDAMDIKITSSDVEKGIADFGKNLKKKLGGIKDDTAKTTKETKLEYPKLDLKGIGTAADETGKALKKTSDSIKDYVTQLKDQARSFANFVGLFDISEKKNVSGVGLLQRLRGQLETMKKYQTSLATLESNGTSKALIEDLRGMGPSAASQISALSKLNAAQLKEYSKLYNDKLGIGTSEANKYLGSKRSGEKVIENFTVNFSNGVNSDSEGRIAEAVYQKLFKSLKAKGVV